MYSFHNIIAENFQVKRILEIVRRVADYKTTVLITGESGTGKELIARALHFGSARAGASFVPINCGGIPEDLLESELFGYVRGAFTGANRTKKGLFEKAHQGTLFLDELGNMPTSLQVKLLRVLQEEEIRPLGSTNIIQVDVRIVAATSKDLVQEIGRDNFREDLFYRVNVLSIVIPALRDRREDIPLLIDYFIKKYNLRLAKETKGISSEAMHLFLKYEWPGNIRELENAIERAMVYSDTPIIQAGNLPSQIFAGCGNASLVSIFDGPILSIKKGNKILERGLIVKALGKTGGNKTKASRLLEISIPALMYKMKNYGIGESGHESNSSN